MKRCIPGLIIVMIFISTAAHASEIPQEATEMIALHDHGNHRYHHRKFRIWPWHHKHGRRHDHTSHHGNLGQEKI